MTSKLETAIIAFFSAATKLCDRTNTGGLSAKEAEQVLDRSERMRHAISTATKALPRS